MVVIIMTNQTTKRERKNGAQATGTYCKDCPVRDDGFCSRLPEPLRKRFRDGVELVAPERTADDNGTSFADWDLAVVSRGSLTMRRTFEDGRRALIDFMFPGEVIHAETEDDGGNREFSASSDFQVCLVPRLDATFDAHDCHCLERYLLTDAITHIEELRDRLAALSRLGPKERLTHLLLDLRRRLNPASTTVEIPFSRSDIADLLGMRMETVSRALFALERANLIRRHGPKRIELLDPDGLESLTLS